MNQWFEDPMNWYTYEPMNGWTNKLRNQWINGQMTQWRNELINRWINETKIITAFGLHNCFVISSPCCWCSFNPNHLKIIREREDHLTLLKHMWWSESFQSFSFELTIYPSISENTVEYSSSFVKRLRQFKERKILWNSLRIEIFTISEKVPDFD